MRKKKILFVDVDIYVAGLCLSPSLVDKTRIALNSGIGNMSSLVDVLFDDDAKAKGKDAKIAVILKFVRGVTTSQVNWVIYLFTHLITRAASCFRLLKHLMIRSVIVTRLL